MERVKPHDVRGIDLCVPNAAVGRQDSMSARRNLLNETVGRIRAVFTLPDPKRRRGAKWWWNSERLRAGRCIPVAVVDDVERL
jgi:hypothetical protein